MLIPKMSRRRSMLNKKIVKFRIKIRTGSNSQLQNKKAHHRADTLGGERRQ